MRLARCASFGLAIAMATSTRIGAAVAHPSEALSSISGASSFLPLTFRSDPSTQMTWREVLSAGEFTAFPPGIPNLGRTSDAVWLRADIVNDLGHDAERVLVLGWPRLDSVRAWRVSRSAAAATGYTAEGLGSSGWKVPWSERPLGEPVHAFPVVLPAATRTILLVRVTGPSEMIFPTQLLSWTEMTLRERYNGMFMGVFSGIVLALAGYNILVAGRLRQRYHLLCATSALLFLFWWLVNAGWAAGIPSVARHLEGIGVVVLVGWHFFRLAFARDFLRLGQIAPRLDHLLARLQWVVVPIATGLIVLLFPPSWQEWMWTFIDVPLVGATFVAGVVAFRAGLDIARWFIPATSLLLIGLILGHTIFAGVLVNPLVAGISIMGGMLFELVVLTLALAEHARRTAAQSEHVLRQATAHRLASLESLVAGVTHELNSPLGALRSTADSFDRVARRLDPRLSPEPAAAGAAETSGASPRPPSTELNGANRGIRALQALPGLARTSRDATDRIDAVVRSLKTFARLDEASVETVDLSEGLRSALLLLHPRVPSGVHIDVDIPELPPIPCRPAELNQAFMAILTNAVESMASTGGRLDIKAWATPRQIAVSVRDTGCGIPSIEHAKLFEPRIVRRGRRVKMGLGLSTVKSIVDAHGGEIEVLSVEGQGTKVVMRIPRDAVPPPIEDEERRT